MESRGLIRREYKQERCCWTTEKDTILWLWRITLKNLMQRLCPAKTELVKVEERPQTETEALPTYYTYAQLIC